MKIETGNFTIYLGDALKIMPDLQADMLWTDPPYPLTEGGQTEGGLHERIGGGYDNGGALFDDMPEWHEFMPLLFNVLKSPGHAYIMANDKNLRDMLNTAHEAGFRFHNCLPWDKGTVTPNRWYMKQAEFTGFFFKGKAFPIADCSSKQIARVPADDQSQHFVEPDEEGNRHAHPTEKPVHLMRHYITNSSKLGDVVIDPFMGTGSTGVAALLEGRRFIGIEKDERWFNVARKRLEDAAARGVQIRML